jgi:aminopeptidase N
VLVLLLALQALNPLARTVDSIRAGQNILHYDFAVSIPDTGTAVEAIARVHFRPAAPAGPLVLDLSDSLHVSRVSAEGRAVPFEHVGDRLVIQRWGPVGDSLVVEIAYGGQAPDGLFIRQDVHGHRSAFADDWPDRAHCWLPVEDHPSDKASVSWTVEVPDGWKAIANGRFVDTTRRASGRLRWRYDEPRRIPPYTFVIGAGPLAVTPFVTPRGLPQSVWTFTEDSAFAVNGPFHRVNEIVDTFTAYIGAFPYAALAHVESSTRFGGMENSGAIFYAERGYASRSMREPVVAHETAHQWFGDAVTERDWHHLWLSEGFATYFAALYYELIGEDGTFQHEMADAKQEYLTSDVVDRPILDFAQTDYVRLLNANNYPKASWVLHMLRRAIGDDTFHGGIRAYYATYRDSTALSEDFREVMERASGQDLGWFFEQWLAQPGFPQLRVIVRRAGGAGGEAVVEIAQVQPEAWGTYRIPVRVDVVNARTGARSGVTVTMTSRSARALLTLADGADTIEVDPHQDVLLTAEAAFAPGGSRE